MRSVEDKEISNGSITFEFQKGNGGARGSQPRTPLGSKPAPSKWDDAQKWLVGFSRGGERNPNKTKPRNSNADDTRLIASVPQQENYYDDNEVDKPENETATLQYDVQTKNIDCEEGFWRLNQTAENSGLGVRSVCVRDMGTEMTPIASQEPSRTATPIRASTPVRRSPISSGASTPVRYPHSGQSIENNQTVSPLGRQNGSSRVTNRTVENNVSENANKINPLETRAIAWDEAERAKYMARYKREEVKIQAWENHEKRKAEMEMKKLEVKAERLKARAEEKYSNKLAATRRIAEVKRANAEAKLNEKAVKTSETAECIRRTGQLPSSISFKLPSNCCQY